LEEFISCNNIEEFESLINKGYDLNKKDNLGRTILFDIIVKGNTSLVEMLCSANANINIQDNQGKTPLHFASIYNNAQIAEILIKSGAEVNIKDSYGNNPLFNAVFNSKGSTDLIILLLQSGTDCHSKNNSGVSAKMLAERIANFNVSYLFDSY